MKIFTMPIYFFRELIFDSKEEYDINSTSFNTRKVLTFLIMVLSICLNIALVARVFSMALEIVEFKEKIEKLEQVTAGDDEDPYKVENIRLNKASKTSSTGSSK